MRTRLLPVMIICLCVFSFAVPVGAEGSGVEIGYVFSPTITFNQMQLGETYVFSVNVKNMDMTLKEGDLLEPTSYMFSGDLILDVSYSFFREGAYEQGDEKVSYNQTLTSWDESYEVDLPSIGGTGTRWFSQDAEYGYDGVSADVDEWVTFNIYVQVFLEQYRIVSGQRKYYIGDLVAEANDVFYVVDGGKVDYIEAEIAQVELDVAAMKETVSTLESAFDETLDVDFSDLEAHYDSMKALFDGGDYVSALAQREVYSSTWREALNQALKERIVELKPYEEQQLDVLEELEKQRVDYEAELAAVSADYEGQLSELQEDYQQLETDHENSTETYESEMALLNEELATVKYNNLLYLGGVAGLALLLVLLLVRMFRGRGSKKPETFEAPAYPL